MNREGGMFGRDRLILNDRTISGAPKSDAGDVSAGTAVVAFAWPFSACWSPWPPG
jgi:hypothetical protein